MRLISIGTMSAALAVAMCPTASAADPAAALAVPTPVSVWTGLYLGMHAGYGYDASRLRGLPPVAPLNALPGDKPSGALVGIQLGGNYVFGSGLLLGAELSGTVANANTSSTSGPFVVTPHFPIGSIQTAVDRMGLGDLKLGWATNNWALYGTAGYALVHAKQLAIATPGIIVEPFTNPGPVGTPHSGWALGAGADVMVSRTVSIGLSYHHLDLGTERLQVVPPPAPPLGHPPFTPSVRRSMDFGQVSI
eukprot:gene21016-21773_t